MPFVILPTNSASISGYNVANSLRFNSGSSDYLSKTFSASNRKTFTISFWLKRSAISVNQSVISGYQDGGNLSSVYLPTANSIQYYNYVGSGFPCNVSSSALFRDVSAWYHVVLVYDSTQATDTNRVKLYVNGSQTTLTGTFPSLNDDSWINSANPITIGKEGFYDNYLSAYLADFYSIDGQALTPTSFGETDEDTGIWKPKKYTGTYGTNGFYLEFKNSASLGTDSSGNGNTFTVNNLTSIDQTTDTPTNNWCTINSVAVNTANIPTMTDGNLTALSTTGSNADLLGTIAVGSGKWYYEAKCISGTGGDRVLKLGWGNPDKSAGFMYQASIVYRNSDGNKYIDNSGSSYGATYTDGDIIGVALDISGGTVTFYKNGTTQGTITISGALDDGTFYIPCGDIGNTDKVTFNFGNPPYSANSYTDGAGYGNFSYAVPSGYYALNTKNLAQFG